MKTKPGYDKLNDTHEWLGKVNSSKNDYELQKNITRTDFNGNVRSFGESLDCYAKDIKEYTEELKKSQPILPVTKIPSSTRINEAITHVNPDGSTNIKGTYKDKDGLTIIKYNEVENNDWENIGFQKGSVSSGIKTKTENGRKINNPVNFLNKYYGDDNFLRQYALNHGVPFVVFGD